MSATVWTILGIIGTTILTAVVGKMVSVAFERSSDLIVTVTVNKSFKSPLLVGEVREWRKKSMPLDEWLNQSPGAFDKYDDYFKSDIYIRLKVKNNSSRKLSAFTFSAHSITSSLMQIGEGELVRITEEVPVIVGDLQPKREMMIHVLGSSFWAHSDDEIKKALVFSADELGRVKYKFPMPFYIKRRLGNWVAWGLTIALVLVTAATITSDILNR
jgi:hypothetical protein